MIQLFRRKNSQGEKDSKDPSKQKWNAESVFVKIDNEYVSLSDLAKVAKDNDYVSIPEQVENEMELNGSVHNISDLITKYQAKKKNKEDVDEEDEKENEMTKQVSEGGAAGAEEDNKDEVLEKAKKNAKIQIKKLRNALDEAIEGGNTEVITVTNQKLKKAENAYNSLYGGSDNSSDSDPALNAAKKGMPKINKKDDEEEEDTDEKENEKDEEDDIEEKIAKSNAKKDVRHFVKLNSVRENGQVVNSMVIDTMHNRVDRGKSQYGTAK